MSTIEFNNLKSAEFPVLTVPKLRKIELQSVDLVQKTEMADFIKKTFKVGNSSYLNLLSEVLVKRGYLPNQELLDLLDPSPEFLKFPPTNLILNMPLAVKKIVQAFNNNTKIGVVGDYDVDGITSVSQIVLCARALGKEQLINWRIPNRFKDGYGISMDMAEDLVSKSVKLVLLLDHGVKSLQVVDYLRSKGVDVIIIDHHALGEKTPNALIVDPEQNGCLFKDFKLCASGLTSFLVNEILFNFKIPRASLGLATLGTICDVVPLDNYVNRNIVKIGLKEIRSSCNHGISQLAEILKIDHRKITSSDIAFYIGPAINAAGRLADGSLCVELLTTADVVKCHGIASRLLELNNNRKDIEKAGFLLAERKLAEGRSANSIVLADENFHSGVVGLIAGKQANRQGVPTAIIHTADPHSVGSVRQGSEGFNVVEALTNVSMQSNYIIKAGGHVAAGGLTLKTDNIESFLQDFEEEYLRQVPNQSASLIVKPDFEIELQDINEKLFGFLNKYLEPFGQGFEQIKFYVSDVEVVKINEKNASAWVNLKKGNKEISGYIGLERWDRAIKEGDCINLVARPMMVFRNQKHTVQLALVDYRKTNSIGSINLRKAQVAEYQKIFNSAVPEVVEPLVEKAKSVKLFQGSLFERDDVTKNQATSAELVAPRLKRKQNDHLLSKRIIEEARKFPSGYLYKELESQESDPFNPEEQVKIDLEKFKREFIDRFVLHNLNPQSFSYRVNQDEATRFVNSMTNSVLFDSPTGSGKTEISFYIAARELNKKNNVLFVAPTHVIEHQSFIRSMKLFLPENLILQKISGEFTRKERERMYYERSSTFFIGIPHAIVNDINDGILRNWPWSLLIVDEVQLAKGDYAYNGLIEFAKENNCQIIGLTGTPAEPDLKVPEEETWHSLEELRLTIGEDCQYYIMGHARNPHEIESLYCIDSEKFASERKLLLRCVEERRSYLRKKFLELSADEKFSKLLNKIVGKNALKLSSSFEIQKSGISELFNNSDDPNLRKLSSEIYYLQLLGDTDRRLRNDGIYSCLASLVEDFSRIHFPIKDKAPLYIQNFFNNRHIKEMLALLSFGPFFAIWTREGLSKALNINLEEWNELSTRKKTKKLNLALNLFKEKTRKEIVKYEYTNHPKDLVLLKMIKARAYQQGIIFVSEVKQVEFLVDLINEKLGGTIKALSLVGKSRKSRDNDHTLDLFRNKVVNILVCTSVGNLGLDIPSVDYGIAYNFSTSMTEAVQRSGRIGRGDKMGSFYMMIGSIEDHGKYPVVLKKMLAETKRRNKARQDLLDDTSKTKPKSRPKPKPNTLFDM